MSTVLICLIICKKKAIVKYFRCMEEVSYLIEVHSNLIKDYSAKAYCILLGLHDERDFESREVN